MTDSHSRSRGNTSLAMGRRQLQSIRIGELLTSLGLVSTKDLNEALQISRDTGLPVGRVLIMSAFISEIQLQGALQAQSLLNDGLITMDQVAKAMDLSVFTSVSFDEALKKTGWVNPGSSSSKLGELLVGA